MLTTIHITITHYLKDVTRSIIYQQSTNMPTRNALQRELLSAEEENALLEDLLVAKRLQIGKIQRLNARLNLCVECLEQELERQIKETNEVINKHEKENIDSQVALEESVKAKKEPKSRMKKLAKDTDALMTECTKYNELLREKNDMMSMFVKYLTPEENCNIETDTVRTPTDKPTAVYAPEEPQVAQSEDCSANNILQQVFSGPQEILDAVEVLSQTIQCLAEDVLKSEKATLELQQLLEIKMKEMQEQTELITSEYDALRDQIEQKKDSIKQKQQDIAELIPELNRTLPQDTIAKLTTVYNCCKNRPEEKLSTLEKLTFLEKAVDEQLQQIEAIRGSKYHRIKNKVIRERTERERQQLIEMEEQKRIEKLKIRQGLAFKSTTKAAPKPRKRSSFPIEKDTAKKPTMTNQEDPKMSTSLGEK